MVTTALPTVNCVLEAASEGNKISYEPNYVRLLTGTNC
jgi:hypothetical protein